MKKQPKQELAPEEAILPPEEAKDAEVIENSLLTKNQQLEITVSGQSYINNIDNALKILHSNFNGNIWFDEFHQKYFTSYNFNDPDDFGKTTREWNKIDDLKLTVFMQREYNMSKMSDEIVNKAVRIHGYNHIKNEPKDWMNQLVWDGTPRIETFFIDCAGTKDTEYTRAVSKNFWIGIAARIFSPGCKLDTMPILEGEQGELKSTLLEVIAQDWHCAASHDLYSKDFFQGMHGKLIIEFADLSSFNKAEVNIIKDILSRRIDFLRLPYAPIFQNFPRQSVFAGTTNNSTYLKDSTGARRFWPLKTGTLNIQKAKDDREQLFAEALYLFKQGEKWWLMPSETKDEQEERREIDPWEPIIYDYIYHKNETTTREILLNCLHITEASQNRSEEIRVGNILRLFKWDRKQKRVGESRQYVYFPVNTIIQPESELPAESQITWED